MALGTSSNFGNYRGSAKCMIFGHTILSCILHECLHWLLALAFCLVVLLLNWATLQLTGYRLLPPITSTNYFSYLVFWVSLAVISHYIGDDVWRIPFWEMHAWELK